MLDPGGVVQSQAVETPDGALRLVLNASQSRRTLSSRFVTEMFGSGVQHIALATDDIVATVERLRANGVDLLPIPENYYEDLEARTDLRPEDIQRLRKGQILYDREGRPSTSKFTRELSKAAFSSRSSSGATTRALVRRTPLFASPHKLASRLIPPCHGFDHA